eukprot:1872606-Rhodomonas_salina.2
MCGTEIAYYAMCGTEIAYGAQALTHSGLGRYGDAFNPWGDRQVGSYWPTRSKIHVWYCTRRSTIAFSRTKDGVAP